MNNPNPNNIDAVPAFATRDVDQLFRIPWEAAVTKRGTVAAFVVKRLGLTGRKTVKSIPLNGNDRELNNIVTGVETLPTCDTIMKQFELVTGSNRLGPLHNVLKDILGVAAGTGVFDLNHVSQAGKLPTLIRAIVRLHAKALKLKIAYGLAIQRGCVFPNNSVAIRIMAALNVQYNAPYEAASRWTAAEPYAAALARATVVSLLGAFYHHYPDDLDLSGDQLMTHVIWRMNDNAAASVTYKEKVLLVLTTSYNTVFQVATAMTIGSASRTLDLGLHENFSPAPAPDNSGRDLFDRLMTNIHGHYLRRNELPLPPAISTIAIPATLPDEFDLKTLTKRMKRQEVREMNTGRWTDYVTAIGLLMDNGKYAELIALHGQYSGGRRIHANPRFLPWHRALLLIYDDELSEAMGKPIRAPYWDWTIDSGNMNTSPMFTPAYFGSWGTTALDNEGILGVFGEFPGSADVTHGNANYPHGELDNGCIQPGPLSTVRNYDAAGAGHNRCVARGPRYNPFTGRARDPTPKTLKDVMAIGHTDPVSVGRKIGGNRHPFYTRLGRAPTQNDFMQLMEEVLHDPVHDGIGGEMAQPPQSSSDPIFWSHHAMIDNVWASWQAKNDAQNANVYDMDNWQYLNYNDDNKGDRLSQGLEDATGAPGVHAGRNVIPAGVTRNFRSTDWMVFFGQNFDHTTQLPDGPDYFGRAYFGLAGPANQENWTVQQLMDDRHMYRTFQYAPHQAKLRRATRPEVNGLV